MEYIQLMYNTGYDIVLTVIFSILTGTCGVYTVDVQHRLWYLTGLSYPCSIHYDQIQVSCIYN